MTFSGPNTTYTDIDVGEVSIDAGTTLTLNGGANLYLNGPANATTGYAINTSVTINGTGTVYVREGAVLTLDLYRLNLNTTLVNHGTVIQQHGYIIPTTTLLTGTFENYGLYDIQNTASNVPLQYDIVFRNRAGGTVRLPSTGTTYRIFHADFYNMACFPAEESTRHGCHRRWDTQSQLHHAQRTV